MQSREGIPRHEFVQSRTVDEFGWRFFAPFLALVCQFVSCLLESLHNCVGDSLFFWLLGHLDMCRLRMFGRLPRFPLKVRQIRASFGHLRSQSGDDPTGGVVVVKL